MYRLATAERFVAGTVMAVLVQSGTVWPVWTLLWLVLLLVNMAAFCLMGLDKNKARQHRRRIPERAFFLLALVGAAPGILAGLLVFRHKTRHPSFTLGIPTIFLLQVICLVIFVVR